MIKAIIFDLDGTLLNTLDDLYIAVNYALKKNNQPLRSKEEVKSFIGNGVKMLIKRSISDELSLSKTLDDFKSYYNIHSMDNTSLYPQINELIKELAKKKIKMGVVSNKFDLAVKEICTPLFSNYMNCFIGESKDLKTKPHKDMIEKALQVLNVNKEEAILIGDSETDIQTAKNCDMKIIGVDWGFRGAKLLKELNADYIVYHPLEILSIIKEINND